MQYESTMLEAMFSGRHQIPKDEKGRYFINRPSKPFEVILSFLQTGKIHWPESGSLREAVKEEVQYFNMDHVFDTMCAYCLCRYAWKEYQHRAQLIYLMEAIS